MDSQRCLKCKILCDGNYYDAIGWFCEQHYYELSKLIDDFTEYHEI